MASRRCCSVSMCCRSSSVNGGAANDSRAFLKRYSLTCSSPISCILSCSYIKPQQPHEHRQHHRSCILSCSYIKPQLSTFGGISEYCCILSCSCIKPQLIQIRCKFIKVVYYHVPTSNHNLTYSTLNLICVVYYHVPTSNHNYNFCKGIYCCVVYYHVPTSNHNTFSNENLPFGLYIIMFLHQTTTSITDVYH